MVAAGAGACGGVLVPFVSTEVPKDPYRPIAAAYREWSRQLLANFNAATARAGVPLRYDRPEKEKGAKDVYLEVPKGPMAKEVLYTDEDLLVFLCGIRPPCRPRRGKFLQAEGRMGQPRLGMLVLDLPAPSTAALRAQFLDLRPEAHQFGLDNRLTWYGIGDAMLADRGGFQPLLQVFARRGCPNAQRPRVWARVLGVHLSVLDAQRFKSLLKDVSSTVLAVDDMLRHDARTVTDDPNFFPFAEVLTAVLIAFRCVDGFTFAVGCVFSEF